MRSPAPEHPDATLAREEISRYYEDQVAEARAELAEAQALLDRREQQRLAWAERGEITAEARAGSLRMEAVLIVSHAVSRYQRAANAAVKSAATGSCTPQPKPPVSASGRSEER